MSQKTEQAVREAAHRLHDAIVAAQAEGYRVTWPADVRALPGIVINATGKLAGKATETTPAEKPADDRPGKAKA